MLNNKGGCGKYLYTRTLPVKSEIFEELHDEVELVFEDMLKCHTCNIPFTKISEHEFKGNCTHTVNLRLSVG